MSQNSHQTLRLPGSSRSRRQGRTQAAFVLRERALRVPTTAVELCGKAVVHPSAVQGFRPAAPFAPVVDGNHDRTDAKLFAADAVVAFGVVSRVAHQAVDRRVTDGLRDGRHEVRRIVAGAAPHARGGDQMTGMVGDGGQLGITPVAFHSAGTGQKVTADVVALQAGRVNGRFRLGLDQAALRGNAENSFEESVKSPFLRRRSCAF